MITAFLFGHDCHIKSKIIILKAHVDSLRSIYYNDFGIRTGSITLVSLSYTTLHAMYIRNFDIIIDYSIRTEWFK